MKQKVMSWIKEPPKQSIWFYLFMILFLQRIGGQMLVYGTMIGLGMQQPELDPIVFTPKVEKIANNTVTNLIEPLTRIFIAGQKVSMQNPKLGMFMGHYISYIIITIWLAILGLGFHGILRYIINWIYEKIKGVPF